jgi:hypothetical protein
MLYSLIVFVSLRSDDLSESFSGSRVVHRVIRDYGSGGWLSGHTSIVISLL